jgi:CRISPR-associated exonuclease Cas4
VIAAAAVFLFSLLIIFLKTERIKFSDMSGQGIVLHSARYGLSGKPDLILKNGIRYVPIEYKSYTSGGAAREWDVAQLLAYCLLVEENLGKTDGGRIIYPDGEFFVPWNKDARIYLLAIMRRMRTGRFEMTEDLWKCRNCEFSAYCQR